MSAQRTALILVLVAAALLGWGTLTDGHDWGGDFASYILQAASIGEGDPGGFLEHNRFTMDNSSFPMGPAAYPWGFPIILYPVHAVFGLAPIPLKMVNVVFFVLALLVFARLLEGRLPYPLNLILVGLMATSPVYLRFMDHILSDIPFLFFSMASLLAIDRVVIRRDTVLSPNTDRLLLGALVFGAYFIRFNGILLLATLGVCHTVTWLRDRPGGPLEEPPGGATGGYRAARWMEVAPYAVFVVLAGATWLIFPRDDTAVLDYYRESLSWARTGNAAVYHLLLPSLLFGQGPLSTLFYGATLPFTLAGLVADRRRDLPLSVYGFATFALYVLVPLREPEIRYLFPVLPLFGYFALRGMHQYAHAGRRVVIGCALLALIAGTVVSTRSALANLANDRRVTGPFDAVSREMFDQVIASTPEDSVIVFFKPRVMRLMTGRDSLMATDRRDLAGGDYLVYHTGIDYGQIDRTELIAMRNAGTLEEMAANTRFALYRIRR